MVWFNLTAIAEADWTMFSNDSWSTRETAKGSSLNITQNYKIPNSVNRHCDVADIEWTYFPVPAVRIEDFNSILEGLSGTWFWFWFVAVKVNQNGMKR